MFRFSTYDIYFLYLLMILGLVIECLLIYSDGHSEFLCEIIKLFHYRCIYFWHDIWNILILHQRCHRLLCCLLNQLVLVVFKT